MKAALIQLNSSDDPVQNRHQLLGFLGRAAENGAQIALTPEVTNCVSASRTHQNAILQTESEDLTLAAVREFAAASKIWVQVGSLALKTDDPDGRFANRSVLISPSGEIVAKYDKIHMFDVQVSETETYRESAGYRPGTESILAQTPLGNIGMTICYDVRFPDLYRRLAKAGAEILTVPSAFSAVTGKSHWETLLRARAIENGCYVLAAAQTGTHPCSRGKQRETYGHSLVVDPWGRLILDAGTEPGVHFVDLDLSNVTKARGRVPSLKHDRDYIGPENAK